MRVNVFSGHYFLRHNDYVFGPFRYRMQKTLVMNCNLTVVAMYGTTPIGLVTFGRIKSSLEIEHTQLPLRNVLTQIRLSQIVGYER